MLSLAHELFMSEHYPVTLTKDSSVKPADKQKIKGYIKRWQDIKIVFGCVFFHFFWCVE